MGNLPCNASSHQNKKIKTLLLFEKPSKYVEISGNPIVEHKTKALENIYICTQENRETRKNQALGKSIFAELSACFEFMRCSMHFLHFQEINTQITTPNMAISHKTIMKSKKHSEIKNHTETNSLFSNRKLKEIAISPEKSFRELFVDDEKLLIPPIKPVKISESIKKDTKTSTPNFYKSSVKISLETNELLPYLPKQPSFRSSLISEERPREFNIKQTKLEKLHEPSEENPLEIIEDITPRQFSIDNIVMEADYSSSGSEPQQIHINLVDLLHNRLKTRKNSLENKETPEKSGSLSRKMVKNDSQTSFKTIKKTDFLSPLKKNTNAVKENLNLSTKPP